MEKIKVLHIGIKNWPHDSAFSKNELIGIRGGGMNKYCDLLINSLSDNIETVILTQLLKGQKRFEDNGNIKIYRIKTFSGRAFRQIIVNILSFFISFKIIKKHKIDIIHGHMQPGIFVAYYLGKIFNLKTIGTPYSFTTNETVFTLNALAKYIEKTYYIKMDKLIFESEENLIKPNEYRDLHFPNSKVIHTGINVPKTDKKWMIDKKIIKILFIGRLVKIKCLDKLILSLLHCNKDTLNKIHIDILGEGEEYNYLKNLIHKNNLSKYITIHGFIEDSECFFKQADLFILPSHMEGLSISLLEAMSYGLACIVNNFGVPFDDTVVYIMKNNEPQTISYAIEYFVNNPNSIKEYGSKARNIIINDFSVDEFANKYVNVYKELIYL